MWHSPVSDEPSIWTNTPNANTLFTTPETTWPTLKSENWIEPAAGASDNGRQEEEEVEAFVEIFKISHHFRCATCKPTLHYNGLNTITK